MRKAFGRALIVAAVAVVLAGCVNTRVMRVAPDTIVISGSGNAYGGVGQLEDAILIKASQETLAAGYERFAIEGVRDQSRGGVMYQPGQASTTVWAGTATTTYAPGFATPYTIPAGSVRIRMFNGEAPSGVYYYDARVILQAAGKL